MSDSSPNVKELFGKAIEFDSDGERAAWLDKVCGENSALRAEIDELLSAYDRADDFMRQPAVSLEAQVTSASESKLPQFPSRYRPVGEIARGGMGVVWRVNDGQFDRPLAVKVMLPGLAGDAHAQARFERESQITGSLQHPAIPPVVDRGVLDDQSPYLSMKLVEGQTLAAILKNREQVHSDLPRLLNIFEQICHAVGYANSQGVVHRDLKPQNVMVGAFGEVQVMDWGMAKEIGDREPPFDAESTTIDFLTEGDEQQGDTDKFGESVTLTRAGQVLGTLAYMPPEQARGEWDQVDARADVFSLGGILCKILTGKAPYVGRDRMGVYQRVVAGDLEEAFSRLEQSDADQELIALCHSCLNVDKNNRPSDASEIAERIEKYQQALQQRIVQERTERVAAELRVVEERKRRRLSVILAASIIAFIIVVGGMAWWIQQNRIAERTAATIRTQQAREDISNSLTRSRELSERYQFDAAKTLLDQAERLLENLDEPAEFSESVSQSQADLQLLRNLDEISLRTLIWTKEGFDHLFAIGKNGSFAKTFRDYGIEIFGDESSEAIGKRIASSDIADSLVAALDTWVLYDKAIRVRLSEIANAADRDPFRRRIREQEVLSSELLVELTELKDLAHHPPATFRMLLPRMRSYEQSSAVTPDTKLLAEAYNMIVRAASQYPADFWLQFNAAEILREQRPSESAGFNRAAIAIRPGNAAAYHNLGLILDILEKPDEAELAYRSAIEIDSNHILALRQLGMLLGETDRETEGKLFLDRAIDLSNEDVKSLIAMGNLLTTEGSYNEAERAYNSAVKLQPGFAPAYWGLGMLLEKMNRLSEAEQAYLDAIEADRNFAQAYCSLGILLIWKSHRLGEGFKLLKQGHEIGTASGNWKLPTARMLASAKQMIDSIDKRLKEIRDGKTTPVNAAEARTFAKYSQFEKKDYCIAVKLYRLGLNDSKVSSEERLGHEYNAGCVALLCSKTEADPIKAAKLRSEALKWFRDSQTTCQKFMKTSGEQERITQFLQHWNSDKDLDVVRGTQIDQLPEDEREGWRDLWTELSKMLDENP